MFLRKLAIFCILLSIISCEKNKREDSPETVCAKFINAIEAGKLKIAFSYTEWENMELFENYIKSQGVDIKIARERILQGRRPVENCSKKSPCYLGKEDETTKGVYVKVGTTGKGYFHLRHTSQGWKIFHLEDL